MHTIGILYPGYAAEDDYPYAEQLLGGRVRLPVVHTSVGEDAHRIDALLDLGSEQRLATGAREVASHAPDAVLWACTSGSFVFGWPGAHQQVELLSQQAGVPASSTSLSFAHAAHALGLARVAVAATYPDDVADSFRAFLEAADLEVLSLSSAGIITAGEVGTLNESAVRELAIANDHPDADALLLPDTALHTLRWLETLEQAVDKPVLTANQVTVWEGLRLAGADAGGHARLGALFRAAAVG